MRILLATDQKFDDKYFSKYSNFALREDIFSVSFDNILQEIQNRLLQKQEHFDLIVFDVDQRIDFESSENILTSIRTAPETYIYSDKNFKLNHIPIVFIFKEYMRKRNGDISLSKFHYNLEYLSEQIFDIHNSGISSSIDGWLNDLAGDLDRLDLNTKFDFSKTNSSLNEEKINDCKILGREFFKKGIALNYNWIGNKLNLLEEGYDALDKVIKQHENHPTFRNEKQIHTVLKTNKAFLLEEKYKYSAYERHLYYNNSRRYIEVDFININHTYYNIPIELFEVKLPNHLFVSKKGILYNSTIKYLSQIGKKYQEYFSNSTHHSYIKEQLNAEAVPFNLSLLIGRKKDLDESKYVLNQALSDFSQHVNIHSFDDLLDKYNFIYKRIKRFHIS